MNSIGKVLVFYTDEMLEMCDVPIRISCQTNDLFSPIKFKITISSSNIYISIARSMYMKANKFVRIFRLSFVIVPNFFFENPNEQSKKKNYA
jgi:hypothetical protein